MIECKKCKSQIPEDSIFCPFCGDSVQHKTKKRNRFVLITIIIAMFLLCLSGLVYYHYITITSLNDAISEKNLELEEIRSQLDDKKFELEESVNRLKEQNDSLRIAYNSIIPDANMYADLQSILKEARYSNSCISLGSKVYAVRMGATITINLNWKSDCTMYMGSDYGRINAEWSGNNVNVKGLTKGVGRLYFGSNSACTQDRLDIAIIVY